MVTTTRIGDRSLVLITKTNKHISIETRKSTGLAIRVDGRKIFECDENGMVV